MKKIAKRFSLLSIALLMTTGVAQAQENDYLNDRWEISGSYFEPDVSLSAGARVTANNGTDTVEGRESAKASSKFHGGMAEVTFRPTQRQRIIGGWYGVNRNNHFNYSDAGTYLPENGQDPIDYSVDAKAKLETKFQLYRLTYGYDFIQTPKTTVTGLVGVYGARLKVRGTSEGIASADGETVNLGGSATWDETRYAPGLGVAASYRPTDRWELRASTQGFKTSWGDFDTDGHFIHTNAQVGYRVTRHVTTFVGYDWFNLKLKDDVTRSTIQNGTTYTASGALTGRLKVHGPTVGVRATF